MVCCLTLFYIQHFTLNANCIHHICNFSLIHFQAPPAHPDFLLISLRGRALTLPKISTCNQKYVGNWKKIPISILCPP